MSDLVETSSTLKFFGTSGPWEVSFGSIGAAEIRAGGVTIADVRTSFVRIGGPLDFTCAANAQLIASSPELFKIAATRLAQLDWQDELTVGEELERAEIFAVLAKVGGQA